MPEIIYDTVDMGLDGISSPPRPADTEAREGDFLLTPITVPIVDGDVLRLEVRNNGNLINTFEGDALTYTESSDIGYRINLYDIIVSELGIGTGAFDVDAYIVRKTVGISVSDVSTNKQEIKLDNPLPDLRGLGDDPIPLYLYHNKTGELHPLVNWVRDTYGDGNLIVKHTPHDGVEKFPRTIRRNDAVEIWDQIINPFSFTVSLSLPFTRPTEEFNVLRGPDFNIDINQRVGKGTGVLTREKILDAVPDIKQRIINKLFSGSLATDTADLNIDHRQFENFIHFSSAEQRVRNFYKKISDIESFNSQSVAISTGLAGGSLSGATGSVEFLNNKSSLEAKRDALIGTFDHYENYLYYESSSTVTNTLGTFDNVSFPKTGNSAPYTNVSVSSSAATTWFNERVDAAQIYDQQNKNILRDLIPIHVRFDPQNNGYTLFVDMIAQHFDVLYNYVDHLNKLNEHDEDVNVGISKDLLYHVLKSFGWEAVSGWDKQELWSYFIGSNESGSYQATSSAEYPSGATLNFVATQSDAFRDLETEPYSRLFNNLPFLYKTKGTARGIRSFLSTYGVPANIIRIQEFGGPDKVNPLSGSNLRELEIENHELITSGALIQIPWHNVDTDGDGRDFSTPQSYTPRTIEFRFRTSEKVNQGLISKDNAWAVWMEHSSSLATSNYGRLHLSLSGSAGWVSASTPYLPLYDNDYYNVFIRQQDRIKANGGRAEDVPVVFELDVKKAANHADGRITHEASAEFQLSTLADAVTGSYIVNWAASGQKIIELGRVEDPSAFNPITNYTQSFNGALQEFRLWRSYLPDYVLDGHTKAPTTYWGTNFSESYDNLVLRLPLGTDNNVFDISGSDIVVSSSHPSQRDQFQSLFTRGLAQNYQANRFNTIDDTYFISTPNSIGVRSISHKIRIEDNSVDYTLDPFKSFERSSFDENPIDLNLVSVALSPQDNIDLDIALQFGGIEVDDIVGDPRDRFTREYTLLRELRDTYFKKFNQENNIFAFLRLINLFNSALFKQVEQMLPARSSKIVGTLIKPSVLERPKVVTEASVSFEVPSYTSSIPIYTDSLLTDSDDRDAVEFTDRFGYTSTYSTPTDEIYTFINAEYDNRDGSRYSFDTLTRYRTTSSIQFQFNAPGGVPIGSVHFLGSNMQFVYTSSADMGVNQTGLVYIPNNTPALNTATKIAIALRDSINNNGSLLPFPLSASTIGTGVIDILYPVQNSTTNILVHTGSAPNGELAHLSVSTGFASNGTGSFTSEVLFNNTTFIAEAVFTGSVDSRLSTDLFRTELFYSSSLSRSLDLSYSSSFELSRFHPYGPRSYYDGTRMTSPDFNIASGDTVDGGPVAQFIDLPPGVGGLGEEVPGGPSTITL